MRLLAISTAMVLPLSPLTAKPPPKPLTVVALPRTVALFSVTVRVWASAAL